MKVTCVVDDVVPKGSPLRKEHGLAFFIEAEEGRVLFDTGGSGAVLLHNLEALGIAPEAIDALALSHAHRDHTGGLPALLTRTRPGLPLYAHPDIFRERFSSSRGPIRAIGMPLGRSTLASRTTLQLSALPQQIVPGVWTTGEIAPRAAPEGRSAHHLVRGNVGWRPDPYRDDMALVLEVSDGVMLLCGCCHAGLLNTLAYVEQHFERPVVAIAGGTHLMAADEAHVRTTARYLALRGALRHIYPGHCTGETAFHILREVLGASIVHACHAGTVIEL